MATRSMAAATAINDKIGVTTIIDKTKGNKKIQLIIEDGSKMAKILMIIITEMQGPPTMITQIHGEEDLLHLMVITLLIQSTTSTDHDLHTLMIDTHQNMIDIMNNALSKEMVWLIGTVIEEAEVGVVAEETEVVHLHQIQMIVIMTETEITEEVAIEVADDFVRAVRYLPVVVEDGAIQWTMNMTITVAVMEAEAIITEGDDPDHIHSRQRPLRRHLHHLVLKAVQVLVDADLHDVDEDDLLRMTVLLVVEVVEVAEAVKVILIEAARALVVEGGEEIILRHHDLVLDQEKVQEERVMAVTVVGAVITAAVVDVIAIEKGKKWKKMGPPAERLHRIKPKSIKQKVHHHRLNLLQSDPIQRERVVEEGIVTIIMIDRKAEAQSVVALENEREMRAR